MLSPINRSNIDGSVYKQTNLPKSQSANWTKQTVQLSGDSEFLQRARVITYDFLKYISQSEGGFSGRIQYDFLPLVKSDTKEIFLICIFTALPEDIAKIQSVLKSMDIARFQPEPKQLFVELESLEAVMFDAIQAERDI